MSSTSTYDTLTLGEKRTVDMTVLGAALTTNGEIEALRAAHGAVDDLVATGRYTEKRGGVLKEAMTDLVSGLFVRIIEAERRA